MAAGDLDLTQRAGAGVRSNPKPVLSVPKRWAVTPKRLRRRKNKKKKKKTKNRIIAYVYTVVTPWFLK